MKILKGHARAAGVASTSSAAFWSPRLDGATLRAAAASAFVAPRGGRPEAGAPRLDPVDVVASE